MREKPTEWVSISDLMAGVMAVVMLLLVVSVLQSVYAEMRYQEEIKQRVNRKKQTVTSLLKQIKQTFTDMGAVELVDFDFQSNKMIIKDNVFNLGSACLTQEANVVFYKIHPLMMDYLLKNKTGQITIEGHTDNLPVSGPVLDLQRYCTVYDDNYTLSAARAREARRFLLQEELESDTARRVIVAGYGDSHPLKNYAPADRRNRRVEVRFTIE